MEDPNCSSSSRNSTPSSDEQRRRLTNKAPPKMRVFGKELLDEMSKKTLRMMNELPRRSVTATHIPDSTLSPEDEEMDSSKYFEKRVRTLVDARKAAAAAGNKLYPRGFSVSITIPEFLDKYGSLIKAPDQSMESVIEYLAGRVMNKQSSPNLVTYDLVGFGGQIQVRAIPELSSMDRATFFERHSDLKNGDYVGVTGFPGKNSMGEMSVIPKIIVNLSYCLHKMPPPVHCNVKTVVWTPGSGRYPDAYILNDQETRFRRRFLDLIINSEVKDIFKTRTKVVSYIRHFLENLGFLEVETPTLTMFPPTGGGGAKQRGAFVTSDEVNMKKMCMRNGPENVYLKQLVVGGIERVFEIRKQFRNMQREGHINNNNPELTTCDFYMAHATYDDLMDLTEQILSGMVKEVTGGYKVTYHANGYENLPIEIDFTPPFRRISVMEELEKKMGGNVRIPKELVSEEARRYLADVCTNFHINCEPPQTTQRLFDKLVGHFVEDTCVNPTFIIDYPEITSPLAKAHEFKQGLTERFILFINKLEIVNGYTVENDPLVQSQRFYDQLKSGNEEPMWGLDDETFYMALEYGIPPTTGWVLGIDWLTMLLTDSLDIKEVILFPDMKPQPPPIKGEDNVENDDTSTTMGAVTIQEALTASKTLSRFLLQSQNTTPNMNCLNAELRDHFTPLVLYE